METFIPSAIETDQLRCFCCGAMKDGYSDSADGTPAGMKQVSVPKEDGVRYSGSRYSYQPGMVAHVRDRESGLRVKSMFDEAGAHCFLDLEPTYELLRIGACQAHLPNLRKLRQLTLETRKIDLNIIRQAMG